MPLSITAPTSARIDEPIAVVVTGAPPGARVDVVAREDDARGRTWTSRATFQADGDAAIDVGAATPVHGDWSTPRPMAFVEAMRPVDAGDRAPLGPFASTVRAPTTLSLAATTRYGDTDARAEVAVSRRVLDADLRVVDAAIDGLDAKLYAPPSTPKGGVVVLLGSGGGRPDETCALLAAHGFAALACAYFGAPGTPPQLRAIDVDVVARAASWLRARPGWSSLKVAAHGRSRGSELALLAAAHGRGVDAVVAVAPSGVPWGGLGPQGPMQDPAWIVDGAPVPYPGQGGPISMPAPVAGAPIALRSTFERLTADAEAVERCTIPIERFAGPVLLVSGTDDAMWPSAPLAEIAVRRRRGLPTEHFVCEGAGHLIVAPYVPTTAHAAMHPVVRAGVAFGGGDVADASANEASWRRTLSFLDEALR